VIWREGWSIEQYLDAAGGLTARGARSTLMLRRAVAAWSDWYVRMGVLDPVGDAVRAWGGVEATPLTWLVAPDGRVLRGWYGRPEVARLRRELDALLPARG
jgi:hypothetical protein